MIPVSLPIFSERFSTTAVTAYLYLANEQMQPKTVPHLISWEQENNSYSVS